MSSNLKKFYIIRFLGGFIFTYTIQSVFLISRGITLPQLATFASLTIIVSTLMEIPTGFIADRFGRKYSSALSYFLDFIAFLVLIFIKDYSLLAVVAVIRGLSHALASGSFESLIYEEVASNSQGKKYIDITTRGSNITIAVGVVATFFGPIIYRFNPSLPFILVAIVSLVSALVMLTFEEKIAVGEVKKNLEIIDGIKEIVKIRPVLLIVLIDLLLLIFVNIYYKVAFFPKIQSLGLDVAYFGVVDVATLAFTSLLLHYLPKFSFHNHQRTLAIFSLTTALIFFLFGIAQHLVPVLIFGMLFDPAWNLRRHVLPTITNQYFSNHSRALSLSTMSFLSNAGAALLIPLATLLFTKSYIYSLVPILLMVPLLFLYPKNKVNN